MDDIKLWVRDSGHWFGRCRQEIPNTKLEQKFCMKCKNWQEVPHSLTQVKSKWLTMSRVYLFVWLTFSARLIQNPSKPWKELAGNPFVWQCWGGYSSSQSNQQQDPTPPPPHQAQTNQGPLLSAVKSKSYKPLSRTHRHKIIILRGIENKVRDWLWNALKLSHKGISHWWFSRLSCRRLYHKLLQSFLFINRAKLNVKQCYRAWMPGWCLWPLYELKVVRK